MSTPTARVHTGAGRPAARSRPAGRSSGADPPSAREGEALDEPADRRPVDGEARAPTPTSPGIESRSSASSIARWAPTRRASSAVSSSHVHVVVAAVRVERQHEPLAGRAELARRAVERRQGDPLHRRRRGRRRGTGRGRPCTGPRRRTRRRRARRRASSAPSSADAGERRGRRCRAPTARRRRAGRTGRRAATGRRRAAAGMAASAAERGGDHERRTERAGDGIGDGVHQLVAGPGHGVVALGAALVELARARSGTWPRGASSIAVRRSHVTGSFSRSVELGVSIARVAPSVARSMPASRLDDSTGRDQRQPEHEPGVAGADRHRAGLDGRTVGGHGGAVEHLVEEVEPGAAQRRTPAAAISGCSPGISASPASPRASRSGAADGHVDGPGPAWTARPISHAERAAPTTSTALWIGL